MKSAFATPPLLTSGREYGISDPSKPWKGSSFFDFIVGWTCASAVGGRLGHGQDSVNLDMTASAGRIMAETGRQASFQVF